MYEKQCPMCRGKHVYEHEHQEIDDVTVFVCQDCGYLMHFLNMFLDEKAIEEGIKKEREELEELIIDLSGEE